MRVVKEISHPEFRVTIFAWNNRFIVKFEQGTLEQTFKLDSTDVTEEQVVCLLDETFISETAKNFNSMSRALYDAIDRLGT